MAWNILQAQEKTIQRKIRNSQATTPRAKVFGFPSRVPSRAALKKSNSLIGIGVVGENPLVCSKTYLWTPYMAYIICWRES